MYLSRVLSTMILPPSAVSSTPPALLKRVFVRGEREFVETVDDGTPHPRQPHTLTRTN